MWEDRRIDGRWLDEKVKVLLGIVLALSAISSRGQGTIDFRNYVFGQLDAPILDCMSTNKLSKSGYVAQLFWSSTNYSSPYLQAYSEDGGPAAPTPVRYQGAAAGYWMNDATIRSVGMPPGYPVNLLVRVWNSADAATFEEVQAKGRPWGQSNPFAVLAGEQAGPGRAANPAMLSGLKSFSVYVCLGGTLSIITQPTNQRFVGGTTASLKIETSSFVPPGYRWQRLDAGGNWMDIPGGTDAVLTFVNAQTSAQGTYRVIVSGGCCGPVTSSEARLTILVPPRITNLGLGEPGFHFDLLGNSENIYSIEVSSDLVTWNNWRTITNAGSVVSVQDADSRAALRFYRVIAR